MLKFGVRKWLLIFIVLAINSSNTVAQETFLYENFTIAKDEGKVFLSWIISSGSTCNGIKIYRSTDSLHFNEIGYIGGVCGSSSSPQPYNFIDDSPIKNEINFYRLEFGGNIYSEIISVEIIDIENGYQIRPNPVKSNAIIYFDNKRNEQHQFLLYNINGVIISVLNTKEDYFNFNSANLSSGIYFFSISNSVKIKTSGRLMIQH